MQRHGKKLSAALSKFRERQALQAQIEQTRHRIDSVRNHFEQVVDPTLIDCYIYEMNALYKKYEYFLKMAKEIGLIAMGYEKIS